MLYWMTSKSSKAKLTFQLPVDCLFMLWWRNTMQILQTGPRQFWEYWKVTLVFQNCPPCIPWNRKIIFIKYDNSTPGDHRAFTQFSVEKKGEKVTKKWLKFTEKWLKISKFSCLPSISWMLQFLHSLHFHSTYVFNLSI